MDTHRIDEESRVKGTQRGRRLYGLDQKVRMVEQTLVPGTSVSRVAREHDVNANQLFTWRRLYRQGRLGKGVSELPALLPVNIEPPTAATRPNAEKPGAPLDRVSAAGCIEVELAGGRLRVQGAVDASALRCVIELLR